MSEEKFVTKIDCMTVSNKILRKLSDIESHNGKLEEMLHGEFGMVNVVKEMQSDVADTRKDIGDIKKNGRLTGRDRAVVYSGFIGGVCGIIIALVTLLH